MKKSFLVTITAIYLFLVGISFFGFGLTIYPASQEMAKVTYQAMEWKISEVNSARLEKGLLPNKKVEEFEQFSKEYGEFTLNFKKHNLEKLLWVPLGAAFFGVIAGFFYILSSLSLFRHSVRTHDKIWFAIVGAGVFYILTFAQAYQQITLNCQAAKQVTVLSSFIAEDTPLINCSFWAIVLPHWNLMAVMFQIFLFFIIPLALLSRIKIKEL